MVCRGRRRAMRGGESTRSRRAWPHAAGFAEPPAGGQQPVAAGAAGAAAAGGAGGGQHAAAADDGAQHAADAP